MGVCDEDLNAKLLAAALKLVGSKALGNTKFGRDCFVLVDTLLRQLGAQTAADGDVKVTPTANYDWGDGILLDSIQPGDILQFHNHVVHVHTFSYKNDKWHETETQTLTRPHHTGIVIEVHKDGSVEVVEQNVYPNHDKVTRHVIPRLEPGEDTKWFSKESKITIEVTGEVSAYHPVCKPEKGASLLHPGKSAPAGGSRRMLAFFVPSQGGAKRAPGSLGREMRQPKVADDVT